MARIKKTLSMEVINQQIEEAQDAVIRAKKKYDEATDQLKSFWKSVRNCRQSN